MSSAATETYAGRRSRRSPLLVRKAAVLGAGAMGSGIAAHLANAGIPSLLLDMVPAEITEDERKKGLDLSHPLVRNRLALKGIESARKGRLPGFAHESRVDLVTPGNLEDDLAALAEVDWVVEAVVERLDVKTTLLREVARHLSSRAVLSTNTSGLSVNAMAAALPESVRPRFFGTHFFNPPRYMRLLELVPAAQTAEEPLAAFHEFAEHRLGKGVVRAKDTPNFVANRIGVFATVYAMWAMETHGLTVEGVDAVTGKALGRAPTATFGTADLAGLDILANAVRTHSEGAPDDEQHDLVCLPAWVASMAERGLVGNKSGGGFYTERRQKVIDPQTLEYRPRRDPAYPSLAEAAQAREAGERVARLIQAGDAAGRFAWDVTAATLLYAAHRVPEIAEDIADIDRAMRWGYAWELGPFELWDALGLPATLRRMADEGRQVPMWVRVLAGSNAPSFYLRERGVVRAYDHPARGYRPPPPRPRQIVLSDFRRAGRTLLESKDAALVDLGDGVACLEFRTKMNVVSEGVLTFVRQVLERGGTGYQALVIGNQGPLFSAGADLTAMSSRAVARDWAGIDAVLRAAQQAAMALKYAPVPVVGAPFGRVLGGGLEVCLHCHRLQAGLETQMGLVEAGVGLIPGAGGVKESLLRAMAVPAAAAVPYPAVLRAFEAIAGARVSGSAWEAFDLGYLRWGDGVTMNPDALVHAAKQAARQLLECGWQTPVPVKVAVLGRDGLANLRARLYNLWQAGFISDHDRVVADRIAWVICGGEVDPGSVVDEQYLLDLERAGFIALCHEPKTIERMQHMLRTGKPLRN